jgi:TetR/AcrR family fatty acid metabolism transcriptional regulator
MQPAIQQPAQRRVRPRTGRGVADGQAGGDAVKVAVVPGEGRAGQRERILDALFDVMSSSGTLGASVTEIAEAAGIARGALHYYFSSKEELKEALMRRLGAGYVGRLATFLDRESSRLADGRSAVAGLARWHFAGDDVETERLLAVWIDYWGQASSNEGIGAAVFQVQEQARTLCVRALLLDRPELAAMSDDEHRLHGASLLAVIEGGLLQWRVAARGPRPLPSVAFGEVIGAAAAAIARAIPPPGVPHHSRSLLSVEVR